MNPLVATYFLYLLGSITMTVLVGMTLSKHGKVYLAEVFGNDEKLAASVNQLLVVGFYLVSLGFVALWLNTEDKITNAQQVLEVVSMKLGTIALLLGAMHLVNVLVFNKIRRRHLAPRVPAYPGPGNAPYPRATAPMAPIGH